jgi:cytochrome c
MQLAPPLRLALALTLGGCAPPDVAPAMDLGGVAGPDLLGPTAHCPAASLSMTCGPRQPPPPERCPPPPRPFECPLPAAPAPIRALLFYKDVYWHHASDCEARTNIARCGLERGWKKLTLTEEAADFTAQNLSGYDVVVFVMTSGTDETMGALFETDAQRDALQAFIRSGKGFAGVHTTSYNERAWPWFRGLVGATLLNHPEALLPSSLLVEDPADPIVAGLPRPWVRCDEYYTFTTNPALRPGLQVLLSLDEDCPSYPGELRLGRHPLAWRQRYDGGRSFYTSLGHTIDSYYEKPFLAHVLAGIEWAAAAPR